MCECPALREWFSCRAAVFSIFQLCDESYFESIAAELGEVLELDFARLLFGQ